MRRGLTFTLVLMLAAVMLVAGPSAAAEKKDKPARGVTVAMLYPGIVIGPDEKVRVDLKVRNFGRSNETMLLEVAEKPEGWRAAIKNYGNEITGIFISEDDERSLTFTAEPEEGSPKAGVYRFVVKARAADGALKQTTGLTVTVKAKKKADKEITLSTSYPVLRGPTDAKFEFSLDINNDADEDKLMNLSAVGPKGWEISFKPAYEQKQISSLKIKAGQSRSVGVEVTPPYKAEVGEYPIKVRVQTDTAKAEVDLKVALTGTYEIKTGTASGLLSLSTQAGKAANVSFYVRNDGSALQRKVEFMSFKPENWKVEFKPKTIDNLPPGELKQVEMIITPAAEAVVGDYSVGLIAQGEKARSNVEFRVTVKASAAWGWIGIAIIVLVMGGLVLTFRRLGRR